MHRTGFEPAFPKFEYFKPYTATAVGTLHRWCKLLTSQEGLRAVVSVCLSVDRNNLVTVGQAVPFSEWDCGNLNKERVYVIVKAGLKLSSD
jgi:hypothetical protein